MRQEGLLKFLMAWAILSSFRTEASLTSQFSLLLVRSFHAICRSSYPRNNTTPKGHTRTPLGDGSHSRNALPEEKGALFSRRGGLKTAT